MSVRNLKLFTIHFTASVPVVEWIAHDEKRATGKFVPEHHKRNVVAEDEAYARAWLAKEFRYSGLKDIEIYRITSVPVHGFVEQHTY